MSDALSSWRDGPARTEILDFIARITRRSSPDYVAPEARIATFDNDGTLWCEYPAQAQVFFAQWRLKALAEKDPGLAARQPFKAFLERDMKTIHELGKKAAFELAFTTHAGMTEEAFEEIARAFFAVTRHPTLGRPFNVLVYRPQIELLNLLHENEFKTFIVSGGGVDLIRAFAEDAYGIPRERVIGSSVKTRFESQGAAADLMKLAELNSFDDREAKPQNIGLHIGRRPILVFGNSDGDLAMMRYAKAGRGPRMALLLHHDDGEREFAYDREFKLSPLSEALDKAADFGITVVSMKRDWKAVFAEESPLKMQAAG